MLKSIVRGFGFTVGRRAADSMIDNLNRKNSPRTSSTSVKDKTCMSHLGYEENDVEIMYDIKWNKEYVKWYEWPLYLFIPIIPRIAILPPFFPCIYFPCPILCKYHALKQGKYERKSSHTQQHQ